MVDDRRSGRNGGTRVRRLAQPAGVRVRLLFAKLHPTTGYLVNVFYQSFAHTE